jgi:hypothetical protein
MKMTTEAPPIAERKTTTAWYVGDTCVITEQRDGRYNISDWHSLNEDGLRRVHACLGQVLTDLAASRTSLPSNGQQP